MDKFPSDGYPRSRGESLYQVEISDDIQRIADGLEDPYQMSSQKSIPEDVHVCSTSEDPEEDSSSYSRSDMNRDLLSESFSQATERYYCHLCCNSYVRSQTLKEHLFLVHGLESDSQAECSQSAVTMFECSRCEMQFRNRMEYNAHLKSHSAGVDRPEDLQTAIPESSTQSKRRIRSVRSDQTDTIGHCNSQIDVSKNASLKPVQGSHLKFTSATESDDRNRLDFPDQMDVMDPYEGRHPSRKHGLHQIAISGSITGIADGLKDSYQMSSQKSTSGSFNVRSTSEDQEDCSIYSHSDMDRDLLSASFSQATKRYYCHLCCKSYVKRHTLKEHLFLVHGLASYSITFENPHQCDQCHRIFQHNIRLEQHKREVHSVGSASRFNCDLCSTVYSRRCDLTKHNIAVHESLNPPQGVSRDATVKNSFLGETVEENIVSQRLPFKCDKCNRMYVRKGDLTRHQKNAHPSDCAHHTGAI